MSQTNALILCCAAAIIATVATAKFVCPDIGRHADPADNHKFYECSLELLNFTCPENKVFDEVLYSCVAGTVKCTKENAFYKDDKDETLYYECKDGMPHHMECRDNKIWNDTESRCEAKPDIPPSGKTVKGSEPKAERPESLGPALLNKYGNCREPGIIIDPEDVHKYFHCEFTFVQKECPNAGLWNNGDTQCVPAPATTETPTTPTNGTEPPVEPTPTPSSSQIYSNSYILLSFSAVFGVIFARAF